MLPPAGTRRWSRTGGTGNSMNLPVAVATLYPKSDWSSEVTWLYHHGFVSAPGRAEPTPTARRRRSYQPVSPPPPTRRARSAAGTPTSARNPLPPGADRPGRRRHWHAHPGLGANADVKTEMAARLDSYAIEIQVYARAPAPPSPMPSSASSTPTSRQAVPDALDVVFPHLDGLFGRQCRRRPDRRRPGAVVIPGMDRSRTGRHHPTGVASAYRAGAIPDGRLHSHGLRGSTPRDQR
jgi:hypothetical protein